MEPLTEKPTLLILNDHCLLKVFQFLQLNDFVNLHNTCHRLRDICTSVCALKYKKIVVDTGVYGNNSRNKISKECFSKVLSVIGQHVLSVEIYYANPFILETIRDKCNNLNSLQLRMCEESLELQHFRNLKELIMSTGSNRVRMSINELKNFVANNPDLESLKCSKCYQMDFMELTKMLPKLKSLRLPFMVSGTFHRHREFQHLLHLDGLTKLSFESAKNCNQLLLVLAKRLNLVELELTMDFDADSFGIIKMFRNLEVLLMRHWYVNFEEAWFSDATVFPPNLKRIKAKSIDISCGVFISIVKQLKFLDSFDLGFGEIYWDHDKCKIVYQNYTKCYK